MKKFNLKKLLSVILCFCLVMTYLPLTAVAASVSTNAGFDRIVDESTMDNWQKYFDTTNLNTENVGGVWTDKSVFTDASEFPSSVKMIDDGKNFLTALSAIAANKEIVGYSTVPTDTVFVLDLSGSMSSGSVDDLVDATNDAINKLQGINNNNRVGVVLYSGASNNRTYDNAVARLMPIDRYTTTNADGDFIQYTGGTVRLARSGNRLQVSGTKTTIESESKEHGGATYIQAGLWEAYKMFDEVPDSEIQISENNWQKDDYRMPIVVLMSDGAPTLGTSFFDDVENSYYGTGNSNRTKSNLGTGNDNTITAGQGFLVQLTASYIKNRIENKYKVHTEKGAGRSLFYSLGFNLSGISSENARNIATAVLNPDSTNITDSLWNTYNSLTDTRNTMSVNVAGRSSGTTDVVVTKNSYATSKSYVDDYFSASGTGLADAFNDIVEEIILQSRYYPTHLEGGSPDFAGYVEFTDTLGEYMEVKHINGILLGNVLFDGHMMASKIADNSSDGLGTVENPTALGDEFIRAVKNRLGIKETVDTHALVAKAYADGQLRYVSADDWSNYIAWYAKADGTYAGFYDEDGTEPVPADAVYINRSYGFLGETTGSIKNSDMMYMSVQVHTNIKTGQQTVIWKIPAALIPMITYKVTLTGTNVDAAQDVNLTVEKATPIRLIYETGLRSDLNEFNISKITENVDTDGFTRLFWNNHFDISDPSHDNHETALAEFTPNKENERFYYTFDSAVYKKSGNDYILVGKNETPSTSGEYYHRRYVFRSGVSTAEFIYERMSAASIAVAVENGYDDTFVTKTGQTGAWFVPEGTPARELTMYNEIKCDCATPDENCEICNPTNSAHMVFHPYLTDENNIQYVDMNLGNNGLLKVVPAQGIKVTKTIDIYETGTSDNFKFRINLNGVSGNFDSWITARDETPSGAATTAAFVNGVFETELRADETLWISGLETGTTYTVEEISDNTDYKIKSVHVNGVSTGISAMGTVMAHRIDDIAFVNTPVGEGDLVITKKVADQNGREVNVNNDIKFNFEVTLKDKQGRAVSGTFNTSTGTVTANANGKFTVTLSEGETVVIRNIPEETVYTIEEKNIPTGFVLDENESTLTGTIDSTATVHPIIVNTYVPETVTGSAVNIEVRKEISGNRTNWVNGESYTFNLYRIVENAQNVLIGTKTITANNAQKVATFTLSGETYSEAGTYRYLISERVENQGGITYDTKERRFAVEVADTNMDGTLEIVSVRNEINTTVSGAWLVSANFNNVYAPVGTATAEINIKKEMVGDHALSGYQFALYNEDPRNNGEAEEILRSPLTDAHGDTKITLSYAANIATTSGREFKYYLMEVGAGQTVNNIKYSDKVYEITVIVKDNGNGTILAETVISGLEAGTLVPTFKNEYIPSTSDFVTISGSKEIVGDRNLNSGEFSFKIEANTVGAPLPSETVVKNDANGSFVFPAIEFADAHKNNVYEYTVSEVSDEAVKIGGFTYDTKVYNVKVTVTDNGETITAHAVIDDGATNDIVFRNTYDPADATVSLSGTKILTGKKLDGGDFEYVMTRVTANAPMPYANETTNSFSNTDMGVIDFGTIKFTKKGVYVYTIAETDISDDNYVCDKSVYTLTIAVTDNSEGVLTATYTLKKDGVDAGEIVFRNSYTPDPIVYDIYANFGGSKVLENRDLVDGEFHFALIDATTGKQIGENVTNANGKVEFPTLTFSSPGTYHYKVSEVVGEEKGITYDLTVYHIVIGVEKLDNGDLEIVRNELHKATVVNEEVEGVLTEVTKYELLPAGSKIEFINTYKADPTDVIISGNKMLAGRTLKANEFTFNLYEAKEDVQNNAYVKGDLLATAKNDLSGTFTFEKFAIKEVGTYRFFVEEDATNPQENVTYDKTVYMVEVEISDNLDGTTEISYKFITSKGMSETLTFLNTYTPPKAPEIPKEPDTPETPDAPEVPEVPKLGDENNAWLWATFAAISTLGILALKLMERKRKEENEQ